MERTDYLSSFERLVSLMTSLREFDIPAIFSTLAQLCKMLRVSKGVTTFYDSPEKEWCGIGEPFVCYDSGEKHVLVSHLRFVTPTENVIVCDVFQAEGAEPLNEEEHFRIGVIQRMMVTYMNKSRQEKMIERLKFWDEDGYTNLRYYYSQIMRIKGEGKLAGKSAARINLKHFSLVNEQVGKEKGDLVLRRYMDAICAAMGPGSVLSRLGGDNFILLFDTDRLGAVIEVLSGAPITYADDVQHPGYIMERIISSYLVAKRDNTDDVVFYTKKLQEMRQHSLMVQKQFNFGLHHEEFKVYYQPKVDIEKKTIMGAEALCRWIHKGRMIPPANFIPELEQGQDICRLDYYMLEHVCRDLRRWIDTDRPVVPVSVNLSRRHLIDPDLFKHIIEIIDKYNIPHALIEIELTETTTDVEFKDLKKLVGQLQDAGVGTSVDDFGVGYSSLNLIKQIPWDVLKLDKSIIPVEGEDLERGTRVFGYIISVAHEIGLRCIAEGVETEKQLEIMKQCGCKYVQGYVFDKPMPVDEFEARLMRGKY